MKNRDFREIQVSSSLLVVIFLGVLALGVFIFLLGVSVGKKQAAAAAPTQIVTQQIPEPAKEPPAKTETSGTTEGTGSNPASQVSNPLLSAADAPAAKPAPKETVADKPVSTSTKPAAEPKRTPVTAPASSGLYYVQVAAYTDRAQALAGAEKYRKQGYTVVVTDPKPTEARTWYRVRLGGYATRDRAVSLLAKLNAAAGKKTDFRIVQD